MVTVVGGGLAGSEAAWQLAERGHDVTLVEMRPLVTTPAHKTDRFAELVCSNTFKSTEETNAHGLLKSEMRSLGSLILWAADQARVPGGSALAVDRDVFSSIVTDRIKSHPHISVERREVTDITAPCIVATGPLTSDALAREHSHPPGSRRARLLRRDRSRDRSRVDRSRRRLSRVAIRQRDDARRRPRWRVPQLPARSPAIQRLHRRTRRRRSVRRSRVR